MEINIQTGDILQAPSAIWRCWAVLKTYRCPPVWQICWCRAIFPGARGRRCCSTHVAPSPQSGCCWWDWASVRKPAWKPSGGRAPLPSRKPRNLQVAAITIGVNGELPLEPEAAAQAFAEGIELGAYRFWHYRTGFERQPSLRSRAGDGFHQDGRADQCRPGSRARRLPAG